MPETIQPGELKSKLASGESVKLIDVRTPAEFQEVHVDGAQNVPLDRIDPANHADDQTIYFVCRSGSRGQTACKKFEAAGMTNVVNVAGGTEACVQAGLPVNRGQKVMSLERQVRIAAGALVVAGTALGFFVHPYWLALPAFVGSGLVFAGVTDTCGMGMMLAKMPWNQGCGSCST
ncbi:Inner membrane protein YgaP [Posidoniimonas polymericola]|uniref:Inner membrane protein YgaP n=1 Tax=Posidoniimonas polymericola TaxID=2528002 RepID=A0A5C5YVC1_9BACT|nr:rhodanese-like domain-containing protein [Posidoniimonas polymericola]TWT78477.1 Inner membrane protein YgaP [Posidoniimonas polymericola]